MSAEFGSIVGAFHVALVEGRLTDALDRIFQLKNMGMRILAAESDATASPDVLLAEGGGGVYGEVVKSLEAKLGHLALEKLLDVERVVLGSSPAILDEDEEGGAIEGEKQAKEEVVTPKPEAPRSHKSRRRHRRERRTIGSKR